MKCGPFRAVRFDLYRCRACRVRVLLVDREGHASRCAGATFVKDGTYLFPPPVPAAKDPAARVMC